MTFSSASIFISSTTGNGCSIAGIIRKILCISNLPSCPFDHVKEDVKNHHSLEDATATPGLVARLMGLDSLPSVETKQSPLLNHVDSHTKSPRNFIPAYQELEDENFFILSFDHLDFQTTKSKKRRRRRRRDSNQENQCVNGRNCKDSQRVSDSEMEIGEIRMKNSSSVLCPSKNSSQTSNGAGKMTNTAKQYNLAVIGLKTEAESAKSSPNSVLDFQELPLDKESANSGDISRLENSKLRRTLSDQLGDFEKSKEGSLIKDGCGEEQRHTRLRNCVPNYAEKWDEISKLAAREVMNSSWLDSETSKNHHLKEIGNDLALEILDQLLSELLFE